MLAPHREQCSHSAPNPVMKYSLRLFFTSALLVPAALSAASFEGKVSFKMTSGRGQPQEVTYNIKGDKMRVEFPGQTKMGGMIMDATKKEMTMIMDEQKMYMTMAIPDSAVQAAQKHNENTKFEKTGETEKILGYTATKYVATQNDTQTDMWLAEGLGTFMGFNNNPMGGRRGGSSPAQSWEHLLAGKELFPLRVVGKDKTGHESFRMEATAINKQSLHDSLFVPPEGYQKLDMGGMMGGMMKGIMQGAGK
jgi:hypothetical protein